MSRYEHIAKGPSPIILRHCRVETRDGIFYTLSRIQDSGVDYSKRNNHIAHHLAFEESEISHLPDPATILLHWVGWRSEWREPPRILTDADDFNIHDMDTNRQNESVESDFPPVIEGDKPLIRFIPIQTGFELVVATHWRKALLQLPVGDRWKCSFTNCLLSTDKPSEFVWAAYWEDRELPYDIPSEPKELVAKPPKKEIKEENKAEPMIESVRESQPQAPIVEIPKEYDFKKAKRPKQAWTPKRMSHFLNTSLVALSLLCVATAVFFLIDYRNSRSKAAEELDRQSSLSPTASQIEETNSETTESAARAVWERLLKNGLIFNQMEAAHDAARSLKAFGDAKPEIVISFLEEIYDQNGIGNSEAIPAPDSLVSSSQTSAILDPEISGLLKLEEFYLTSHGLAKALAKLQALEADTSMIEERLMQNAFRWDDLLIGLKECRRIMKDQLSLSDPSRYELAQEYDETYQKIISDNRLKPYLEIHELFGRHQNNGYMAVDASGFLSDPEELRYANFLQRQLNEFILPRYSVFKQNPEFRIALRQAGSENLTTSLDVAKAIEDTLAKAEVTDKEIEEHIASIRLQWQTLFSRKDLMEETIIAFSIERIEEAKRRLASLQRGMEADDLLKFRKLQAVYQTIDEAEKGLLDIKSNQDWVVIHLQPSQL